MLILSFEKSYWIERGWTIESCERRLAEHRKDAREYRQFPEHTRFSYRLINANLYRKTKIIMEILKSDT